VLNVNGPATMNSTLHIFSNLDSSGSGSGSFITSGGVGIALSCNIGLNLSVVGTSIFTGAVTINNSITSSGLISFTNVLDASNTNTAAVVLSGGLAVTKSLYIGSNFNSAGSGIFTGSLTASSISVSNSVTASGTTDSSGLLTGTLQVSGGGSISKNL